MQIGKFSLHTEKAKQNIEINRNNNINKLSTNPFGVSFKGNVIQADVFETKKNEKNSISEKGKLFASAVVSGINNFNESFKARMNAVVSFGKKITNNVFDTFEKIGNTEISFNIDDIKNKIFPDRQYSVKNLSMKSIEDLKTMWQELEPIEE